MKYKVYIAFLLLVFGCGKKEEHGAILARVGDAVITADEFVFDYEFGHGHLRSGSEPQKEYLNFLIYEHLLAQEASAQHFDTLDAIAHAMHTLREELLIEQVFKHRVLSQVEVSDEEIRTEINKDAVSFQFRLLPADSERMGQALYQRMLISSFGEVMEAQLDAVPELRIVEGELTSPLVKAEDLDPQMLAILKELPINEPSTPQLYQGSWFLFEVMNISRQRLSEEDYIQKKPSYHKILYNRKALDLGTEFVAETMAPLDVSTKRAGFEVLNSALFDWYEDKIPERNLLHYIEEGGLETDYTAALIAHYDTPITSFGSTNWRIYDFLKHFTPGRYVLRPDDEQGFKARLADVVALVARDVVLMEMADREGLEEDEVFNRTLQRWKSKWLFQEYRNHLIAGKDAGTARILTAEHAESLKDRYKVEVNWAMLDTLQTSLSTINPTMTVHLFKNNANKMPFPIVDPNWKTPDSPLE